MLRPGQLRPYERAILCGIALLLASVGLAGLVLAWPRGDWRLLLASLGGLGLAGLFFAAARRGRPL